MSDQLHRGIALGRAIAADRVQGVARHTFRVHADQNVLAVSDLAHNQRDVRVLVDRGAIRDPFEVSEQRGQIEIGDFLDEFLRTHAVRDKILYGNQFELVPVGVTAQTLQAFHRSVVGHNFADDAGGVESREPR